MVQKIIFILLAPFTQALRCLSGGFYPTSLFGMFFALALSMLRHGPLALAP